MQYVLKVAAIRGEIIPLLTVAEAMAMRDATAGGTPPHEPTFRGRLTGHILGLLEEVRSGRLKVCDTFGNPLPVDEKIGATEHFGYEMRYVTEPDWEKLRRENPPVGNGVWNFSHLDLGPQEKDPDSPRIAWFSKLKMLNEWAEKRGDSFVVSHEGVGWFDERGYVTPTEATQAMQQEEIHSKSGQNLTTASSTADNWIESARIIWEKAAGRHKNLNQEQIAEKVHQEMKKAKERGESGMTGRGNKVPSAGTIRRHRLKGIRPFKRSR